MQGCEVRKTAQIMLPVSPQPSGENNKTLWIQPAAPEFSARSAAWTAIQSN
jgi:hypothetical protein